MITQRYLKGLFDYDDGNLIKAITHGRGAVGSIAGTTRKDGYVSVMIDYKLYLAHRIIYQWHFGNRMPRYIDHIDRNPSNNRVENLRACDMRQNSWNAKKSARGESGYRGVSWDSLRRKWRASIRVNGKNITLGRFDDPIMAAIAYDKRAFDAFGEFASTNFLRGMT